MTGQTPMPDEGNVICVRIGGYYTVVPLSDVTSEALDQIEGPDWQEVGIRFARLQRAVDRSSQS